MAYNVFWDETKGKSSATDVVGNGDGMPDSKGKVGNGHAVGNGADVAVFRILRVATNIPDSKGKVGNKHTGQQGSCSRRVDDGFRVHDPCSAVTGRVVDGASTTRPVYYTTLAPR